LDDHIDLKRRVNKLERQVAFLLKRLELDFVDKPSLDVPPSVMEMVQAGNMIGAIKADREDTGVDLKTAKDFIETLM
jgi:hypothetical protein